MRNWRIALMTVVAIAAGAAVLHEALAQPAPQPVALPTRVAVCDVELVFKNYRKASDLSNDMKKKADEIKAEDDKRDAAIKNLQMEVEQLLQGSNEYQKRQDELQMKVLERKNWRDFQEQLAQREYARLTKIMYDDIMKAVGETAKEQGFQVVLYSDRSDLPTDSATEILRSIERRKVLYSDSSVDLTEKVLLRLNGEYKSGQK